MFKFKDGTKIKFNQGDGENPILNVEFSKEFNNLDVEILIKIDGEITNLKSGEKQIGFEIKKRF